MPNIPEDAIVTVEFSAAFYKRIIGLYFNYLKKNDPKKIDNILDSVLKDTITKLSDVQDQIDAYSLETLFILIKTLDIKFKETGKIIDKEVEIPTEDSNS